MIFFDTTSSYFEVDVDDPSDDAQDVDGEVADAAPLRRLGHSKDHRPDLPQVVIGLAVTREGSRCGSGSGPATETTRRWSSR